MTDTASQPSAPWRSRLTFERAINWAISFLVAYLAVTLALVFAGVNAWRGADAFRLQSPQETDLYFGIVYAVIAVLYAQNLLFFYQTREPLFKTYCLFITFIALNIVFYSGLLPSLGLPVPAVWAGVVAMTAHNIGMIFIIRFARQLLQTERTQPKLDWLLKVAMVWCATPVIAVVRIDGSAYFILDLIYWSVFGGILLFVSAKGAGSGNTAARIFFFSYLAQYLGCIWSYVIFIFPETAATLNPFYSDNAREAEASVWFTALALEALLMSLAAQHYVRESKAAAEFAKDQARRLERAIRVAQSKIADQGKELAQLGGQQKGAAGRRDGVPLSEALRSVILDNAAEPFIDVSFLASATAMSKATLQRRLKEETGQSPNALIRQVRLDLARDLMTSRQARTVGEAMAESGFSSMGHFAKAYREAFGERPADTLKRA